MHSVSQAKILIFYLITLKERHEAVVRRTIERSQKPKQKQNRWSWGGTLHTNNSINNTGKERVRVSQLCFLSLGYYGYFWYVMFSLRKPVYGKNFLWLDSVLICMLLSFILSRQKWETELRLEDLIALFFYSDLY